MAWKGGGTKHEKSSEKNPNTRDDNNRVGLVERSVSLRPGQRETPVRRSETTCTFLPNQPRPPSEDRNRCLLLKNETEKGTPKQKMLLVNVLPTHLPRSHRPASCRASQRPPSPRAADGVHRCDVQWRVVVHQSGGCDCCEGSPERVACDEQLACLALLVVEPLYRLVHAFGSDQGRQASSHEKKRQR